jgi:hypothetical protein
MIYDKKYKIFLFLFTQKLGGIKDICPPEYIP